MSNTVDTRVVEMQFNNQNFEKNVATSLGTLDKLKNALNFGNSAKQLTNLQTATNNVDFSPFTSALDAVQSRFSMLGIVGATVISNLTTTLMGKAKQLLTAIPNQISQGGLSRALNIEQAKFQLKGLGVAWKDIEDDINYGVKDTAYGLDAAAKAASQLTASGVQLGDEMKEALRGISGVAAMTNASYEEISPIFTTVAGQGKLMTMQLRQLESRGLNVAAELGKQMGKTEEEIRDMVTKGKIDFKTFSHYMNEAFGDHAKKANETYTGALSNVKAALSRIGAEFKQSRLENLRQVFVAAIPAINKFKADIAEVTSFLNLLSSMVTHGLVRAIGLVDFSPVLKKVNNFIEGINVADHIRFGDVASVLKEVKEEGVLTNETLKKTEALGLNVTKVLAERLDKTEEEVREMITNGEVDFLAYSSALGAALASTNKYVAVAKAVTSKLGGLFRNIFNLVQTVGSVIKSTFSTMSEGLSRGFKLSPLTAFTEVIAKLSRIVFNVNLALSNLIKYMTESGNNTKVITFFQGVGTVLRNLYSIISTLAEQAIKLFNKIFNIGEDSTLFTKAIDLICNVLEALGKIMIKTDGALNGVLDAFINFAKVIGGGITSVIDHLGATFGNLREDIDQAKGAVGSLRNVFDPIVAALKAVAAYVGDAFAGMWENFTAPFKNNNTNFLLSFVSGLELAISTLLSLHVIDALQQVSITFERFKGIISTIKQPFWDLQIALKAYQQSLKADLLKKIATAVLMIAGAMLILSLIDRDKLMGATVAMTEMMYALVGAFTLLDKMTSTGVGLKGFVKARALGGALVSLSVALLIMSAAVKNLSALDNESLAKGLGAVASLLGIVLGFFKLLNNKVIGTSAERIASISKSLIIFAIALNLLVKPVKDLGSMDLSELEQGVGAIAGLLGIFAAFFKVLNSKIIGTTATRISEISKSLVIFAIALNLLVIPVKTLGGMSLQELEKGLGSVAGLLGIFAVFFKLINTKVISTSSGRINSIAKSLIIFGIALSILTIPVKVLGGMDLLSLAKGLGSVAITLGILLAAIAIMSKIKINNEKLIKFSASLLIMAAALLVLSKVIGILGAMDPGQLILGLIGLGAALTIVVLAGIGAEAAAAGLMALGGAIALIGLGVMGIGTGLFMFAAGLSLLTTTGAAGLAILAQALLTVINMIPVFLTQLGYGLIALMDVLSSGYDSFVRLGVTLIVATCDAIIQSVPKLIETIGVLLDAVEVLLFDYAPRIINWGTFLLLSLIDGITQAMPDLVEKAFVLIITFINSMSDALDEHGEEFWDAVDRFILSVLDFLGLKVKDWAQAAKDWLAGLKQGFEDKAEEIKENIKQFVNDKIVQPIKDKWEDFKKAGREIIIRLKTGIVEKKNELFQSVKDIIDGAKQKIEDFREKFKNAGKWIMQGLVDGIKQIPIVGSLVSIADNGIRAFKNKLGINSPSRVFMQFGIYVAEGFELGVIRGLKTTNFDDILSVFDLDGLLIKFTDTTTEHIKEWTNKIVETTTSNIKYGASTISEFLKDYLTFNSIGEWNDDTISKRPKTYSYYYKLASDAVAKFSVNLYKNSQAYEESIKNVADYNKSLKEQQNRYKALKNELASRYDALWEAGDVDSIREYNRALTELEGNIEELTKNLEAELRVIADGPKEAYQQYRQSIRESVINSASLIRVSVRDYVNLFERMNESEEISVNTLLSNMQSQIVGISKWKNDLSELAKRGVADGLLKKLKDMGPDGAKYINTFMNMTTDELKKANLMFMAESELTSNQLIDNMKDQLNAVTEWSNNISLLAKKGLRYDMLKELVDQGSDNAEYVQALVDMTAEQISEVNSLYTKQGELPSSIADNVLAALTYAFGNNNSDKVEGAISSASSAVSEVLSMSFDEVALEAADQGTAVITALSAGMKSAQPNVLEASRLVGSTAVNEFKSFFNTESGSTIAINMTDGLVSGIETGSNAVAEAAIMLANKAYDSIANELEIHSPSKKMMEIGRFTSLGLAEGLVQYSSLVYNSAENLGETLYDSIKESMEMAQAILNEDVMNPVIKPTLDLSDVSRQAGGINRMFNDSGIGVHSIDGGEIQNGSTISFVQNNYSPKALPRIEIYRQTKNQISTLKGLVNKA